MVSAAPRSLRHDLAETTHFLGSEELGHGGPADLRERQILERAALEPARLHHVRVELSQGDEPAGAGSWVQPSTLHGVAESADGVDAYTLEVAMAEPVAELPDIGEVALDGPGALVSGGEFVGPVLEYGRGRGEGASTGPAHVPMENFRALGHFPLRSIIGIEQPNEGARPGARWAWKPEGDRLESERVFARPAGPVV